MKAVAQHLAEAVPTALQEAPRWLLRSFAEVRPVPQLAGQLGDEYIGTRRTTVRPCT